MSRTESKHAGPESAKPFLDSLDASLPALPGRRPSLSPREVEVRYFVPESLVPGLTRGLEYVSIRQHYFPSKALRSVIEQFKIAEHVRDHQEFSSGRIRRTKDKSGSCVYELEFKGPKEDAHGALISRREFGVRISKELFEDLLPEATAGALKKRRYEIAGKIVQAGTLVKAYGHLDVLRRAGNDLEKLPRPFCTIDIELRSPTLIRPLRAGNHSFKFLRECLEINGLDNDLRETLSNRAIARSGLAGHVVEQVQEEAEDLERMLRKLRQ